MTRLLGCFERELQGNRGSKNLTLAERAQINLLQSASPQPLRHALLGDITRKPPRNLLWKSASTPTGALAAELEEYLTCVPIRLDSEVTSGTEPPSGAGYQVSIRVKTRAPQRYWPRKVPAATQPTLLTCTFFSFRTLAGNAEEFGMPPRWIV